MTHFDRERALSAPEAYFRHPAQVVTQSDCSDEDKISILLNWKNTLIQLQTASEENMLHTPGNSNDGEPLADVTKALSDLGYSQDPAAVTTATGGNA